MSIEIVMGLLSFVRSLSDKGSGSDNAWFASQFDALHIKLDQILENQERLAQGLQLLSDQLVTMEHSIIDWWRDIPSKQVRRTLATAQTQLSIVAATLDRVKTVPPERHREFASTLMENIRATKTAVAPIMQDIAGIDASYTPMKYPFLAMISSAMLRVLGSLEILEIYISESLEPPNREYDRNWYVICYQSMVSVLAPFEKRSRPTLRDIEKDFRSLRFEVRDFYFAQQLEQGLESGELEAAGTPEPGQDYVRLDPRNPVYIVTQAQLWPFIRGSVEFLSVEHVSKIGEFGFADQELILGSRLEVEKDLDWEYEPSELNVDRYEASPKDFLLFPSRKRAEASEDPTEVYIVAMRRYSVIADEVVAEIQTTGQFFEGETPREMDEDGHFRGTPVVGIKPGTEGTVIMKWLRFRSEQDRETVRGVVEFQDFRARYLGREKFRYFQSFWTAYRDATALKAAEYYATLVAAREIGEAIAIAEARMKRLLS